MPRGGPGRGTLKKVGGKVVREIQAREARQTEIGPKRVERLREKALERKARAEARIAELQEEVTGLDAEITNLESVMD